MYQNSTAKNRTIEFYRFLFACIIFVLHVRHYGDFEGPNGEFNGGYLGVEFFFILSGFLLMQRIQLVKASPADGGGGGGGLAEWG